MKEKKEIKHPTVIGCCDEYHVPPPHIRERILTRMHKLGERGNVVMTRLNDANLEKIDALVEVEVFGSRSEAAAFFIREGIQARKDLFEKVMPTVDKIKELRQKAKESLGRVGESESTANEE